MTKGHSNPRYKTALCKKFLQSQTCPYGDKCQFAHGEQELRNFNNNQQNMMFSLGMGAKNQNMLNYKIIKCKNWEKDKTCKYGMHCTFAHGDEELRNKADNLYQMNPNFTLMMPFVANPNMDMAQMQQFMPNNQFIMPIPMNINNENVNVPQNQNNEKTEQI